MDDENSSAEYTSTPSPQPRKPVIGQPPHNPNASKMHSPTAAQIVHLPDLPPVKCPCGLARRAFADSAAFPGTVHLTEITSDAQTHHHTSHTEVYVILQCEPGATIELDGEPVSVRPYTSVLIPPGVRHRACGKMQVLIICTPEFDPADEHLDG